MNWFIWFIIWAIVVLIILYVHYKVRKFGEHQRKLYEDKKDV